MSKPISSYYLYVKSRPCVACGNQATLLEPNDADHIQPPSTKLPGQLAPRTHNGLGAYYCLPLCKPCHLSRHMRSESDWYADHVGKPAYVYGILARQILEYYQEFA